MAEFQAAASHFKCRLQGTEEEWDGLDLEYEKSNYLNSPTNDGYLQGFRVHLNSVGAWLWHAPEFIKNIIASRVPWRPQSGI